MKCSKTNENAPTSARNKQGNKIYSKSTNAVETPSRAFGAMSQSTKKNAAILRAAYTTWKIAASRISLKQFLSFDEVLLCGSKILNDVKDALIFCKTSKEAIKRFNEYARPIPKVASNAMLAIENGEQEANQARQKLLAVFFEDCAEFLESVFDDIAEDTENNNQAATAIYQISNIAAGVSALQEESERKHKEAQKRGRKNQKAGVENGNQSTKDAALWNQIMTECRNLEKQSPHLSFSSIAKNVSGKHLKADEKTPIKSAKTIQNRWSKKK